ncbi:hypothetical protein [Streptomyces lydicus]|uniref:hypothetical protein n=1 Tax=Streptomyces lydicus TaxID=47763 RepID=UPI000524C485|nr:hypothetical protein [Streptomyces lydicus]MDC7336211.1 hypothetical protein [Streptomyces lydicus]UEG94481.1 hypothetical protein LJ741_30485 [Streptomyces lydicus]
MTETESHAMHDDHLAAAPPRVKRRRPLLMALIVFLLIAIPAGYIVISAEQSRDSGEGKEAEAAATGLTNAFPTKVQQRIYNVPVPIGSTPVYYYETNSWQTSSLFVQFRTNEWGLEHYLAAIGTSTAALKKDRQTIPPAQAAKVGWDFSVDWPWAGTTTSTKAPHPAQRIMVSYDEPGHPVVYTVSTVNF